MTSSQAPPVPVLPAGRSVTGLPSASMYFMSLGPFCAFLRVRVSGFSILVITCFMLSSAIMGLIDSKCVGARSVSSLRSLTCPLMPLLCSAIRWLMLVRWFSRRRSSSATLVWSSTSLELAFDGVLATIVLALPCFFSVPLLLEKKFSRLNASSSLRHKYLRA